MTTEATADDLHMRSRTSGVSFAMRLFFTLCVPFLLVMMSIRLVMTPLFLQIEYTRADFPVDIYGFSTEDRLAYSPYPLNYLLNADDISYLGNLRFPDGKSMYNARELHHMRDVKIVTQYADWAAVVVGAIALILIWRLPRPLIQVALFNGSIFTLALIAAIVIVAILNWDFFFTGFHSIFFASGTWRFEYSDTLIRLFPEQFWFDASLTIGGFTVLGALAILTISRRGSASARPSAPNAHL